VYASVCRETELKQLQGWKATVENLQERFEDLIRQTTLLADIEAQESLIKGSAADGEGDGEDGAGGGMSRSALITPNHTLQLNKLR
jgi:hypothetical protein